MKRVVSVVAALAGAALLPSLALGQIGYEGTGGAVQSDVQGGGSLPFTGLDLALIVGGGLCLVLVGLVLRRAARGRA